MTDSPASVPSTGLAGPAPAARLSAFDRGRVHFDAVRLCAAAWLLAFAGLLGTRGGLARVLAALIVADVAIMSLPWRVPRDGRTMRSIVAENLAYQAAPLCAVAAVLVADPVWIRRSGAWFWYPAALVLGTALVALSGLSLRRLWSGELAFLAGPRPGPHAAVRVAGALAAPSGEEVIFRGVVFLPGDFTAALSAVAAVAFVARHYVPPRVSRRLDARGLATQAAAAAVMLGLTVASRTLYPAIAAHLINNAAQAVLEIQRWRTGGQR